MGAWELVLQYVQALAWPVVVVTGVFVFKDEIRSLINRLKKFGALGVTVEADSEVAKAAEAALGAAVLKPSPTPDTEPTEHRESSDSSGETGIAFEVPPAGGGWREDAVLQWGSIERIARELGGTYGLPSTASPLAVVETAVRLGDLTADTADLTRSLQGAVNALRRSDEVQLTPSGVASLSATMSQLGTVLRTLLHRRRMVGD